MSNNDSALRFTPYVRRVLIALGFAAVFIVLLFVTWRIGEALLVIFAGILFALFLSGFSSWLSRKTSFHYRWGLFCIVLGMIFAFAAASAFLGVWFAQQASQLYQSLIESLQHAWDWLQQFPWAAELAEQADGEPLNVAEWTAPVVRLLRSTLQTMTLMILVVVIGFYLAASPGVYVNGILRMTPVESRSRAQEVLDALQRALQGWLLAQFVSMTMIGSLVAIGLWLFGIELWLILGLLAGLLTFIPNLGPILAGIPTVLLALDQSLWLAFGVLLYYTAVQSFEGYFVTPMVQDRVIHVPPAATLSIQLLMAYAFGLLGVAVAAPLLAAIMVLVEMLYVQDFLGDRDIEVTGQQASLSSGNK